MVRMASLNSIFNIPALLSSLWLVGPVPPLGVSQVHSLLMLALVLLVAPLWPAPRPILATCSAVASLMYPSPSHTWMARVLGWSEHQLGLASEVG